MTTAPENDFAQMLEKLQQDSNAIKWPERRALAKAASESLRANGPIDVIIGLLFQLANDPKWEVRQDVADSLLDLPDDDFPRLTAKLSADSNQYVRRAAERALVRKQRGQKTAQHQQRGLDQVTNLQSKIEKKHGKDAAVLASQMAERLYDTMIGTTVHDLKGFLTPTKSSVNSLLAHLESDTIEPYHFKKTLSKMSDRLKLVDQLLDDMRFYSQTTPSQRKREQLYSVISEAHTVVTDGMKARERDISKVSATISIPENITFEISRYQIVVSFSHIIKNAYEAFATGPNTFIKGNISISAKLLDLETIGITISDDGMGLSEADLEDVRRFVPGGSSKKTYGTGFGLPTARRRLIDHGGSLTVDSEDNKGTTVTMTIPIESNLNGDSE